MPVPAATNFTRNWRQLILLGLTIALLTSCSPASGNAGSAHTLVPSSSPSASARSTAYSGAPGPGWTLTWSDDFEGPAPFKGWTFSDSTDGNGNKELQEDDPANASESPGGGLAITASRDDSGAECWYGACQYSAARMDTEGSFAQEYGLFEARIKLPSGHGMWPAFWMEGSDIGKVGWPDSGEIDVVEVSNKTEGLVSGFIHAPEENYGAYYNEPYSLSSGYHVYAIEWTPSGVTWLVDGHAYGHIDSYPGWPFSQPFFLILDVAVGGTWPGSPDSSTKFPEQMNVSWIRVYKKAE